MAAVRAISEGALVEEDYLGGWPRAEQSRRGFRDFQVAQRASFPPRGALVMMLKRMHQYSGIKAG